MFSANDALRLELAPNVVPLCWSSVLYGPVHVDIEQHRPSTYNVKQTNISTQNWTSNAPTLRVFTIKNCRRKDSNLCCTLVRGARQELFHRHLSTSQMYSFSRVQYSIDGLVVCDVHRPFRRSAQPPVSSRDWMVGVMLPDYRQLHIRALKVATFLVLNMNRVWNIVLTHLLVYAIHLRNTRSVAVSNSSFQLLRQCRKDPISAN